MANPNMMAAVVKSVLSSDTLILRSTNVVPGQLPKERTLRLEGLTGPRIGNRDREEELGAFEAREFLRSMLVNKPVKFAVTHTVQGTQSGSPVEYGIVHFGSEDVALKVVQAGWAKVREGRNPAATADDTNEDGTPNRRALLQRAQEDAKRAELGLWDSESLVSDRKVNFSMPDDSLAFLDQHKGKRIEAVVEAVPNGSTLRVRLILSPELHQVVSLGIAGIRSPRSGKMSGDPSGEEFGDEARLFVESRLLQRFVAVTLLSLPTSQATQNANGSTTASMFLGPVHSPAGNIASLIVAAGLARVVDWHAGFLSQSATPNVIPELRQAEATAKTSRRGIWRSLPLPASGSQTNAVDGKTKWNGLVTRIWSADSLGIVKSGEQQERRIQLSSVRQPKPSDPRLAGLQVEGKEALRKKLIGKPVHVTIDYVKPAEGDYEERECATVRTTNGQNVAENLVERGLLSLIRHRQNDDQRSSDYDKLMAAEAKAVSEQRGVHSDKEFPAARIVDASETAQKAAPFLSSLKRAGRTAGVVDFVSSGSRFKVFVPKQQIKLTLVLGGIRCPRTARNASEKGEPFGAEAAAFASRSFLQRDCEFEVDTNDKSGGFIGKLYVNKEDVALSLVREGLARVDDYATDRKDLWHAQDLAQKEKKNLWQSYVPEAKEDVATNGKASGPTARKEYLDIIVSDVRPRTDSTPFSFAVQILKDGGIPELEKMMSELTMHYRSAENVAANFVPRSGDVVAARFTADDQWYRAKVKRANPVKKEVEVLYIDYGNSEIIPFGRVQQLGPQFRELDGQSKEATLSFVNLLGPETDYGLDAIERFRELCEGRQLVANVDHREPNLLHLSLYDPKDPTSLTSHEASINVGLVKEGLARIDTKCRFRSAYPATVKALDEAVREAKRTRAGAYEHGDMFDDE